MCIQFRPMICIMLCCIKNMKMLCFFYLELGDSTLLGALEEATKGTLSSCWKDGHSQPQSFFYDQHIVYKEH